MAETCGFRDEIAKFTSKGYVLFGASRDDTATLAKFKTAYHLNYTLLSDPKDELANALGLTPGARQTVVIGKDGKVQKVYKNVDAKAHPKELLKDLK